MPKQHNYKRTVEELTLLQQQMKNSDSRSARRAQIVYQLHLGYTPQEVAILHNVSLATVYNSFKRFSVSGVAGLADQSRGGRPRKATAPYTALVEVTLDTDPQSLGYAFTVWTLPRLCTYLAEQTGIELSERSLQRLLTQQDYRYRRPKRDLGHKHDPVLREQVQGALDEVKKERTPRPTNYSLWTKPPLA